MVQSQTATSPRTRSSPRTPAVGTPAASSIHRMLRRVASASSSAVGGSAGQRPQQREHAGAMRLQCVDPPHQEIEQAIP